MTGGLFAAPETAETSDQLKSIQIVMLMAKMAPSSLARARLRPNSEHRSKSISARGATDVRTAVCGELHLWRCGARER